MRVTSNKAGTVAFNLYNPQQDMLNYLFELIPP